MRVMYQLNANSLSVKFLQLIECVADVGCQTARGQLGIARGAIKPHQRFCAESKVSRCESILCLAPGLERKKRFDGKPERIMDAGSGPRPLAYVRMSGKTGCELIPIGQDLTVHTLTAPKRVD